MSPNSVFRIVSFSFIFFLSLTGCTKEEGVGGTSTIKGKVLVHDFDAAFQNPAPSQIYAASDQKVYIIYGADKSTYDDDYSTTYDGTYEFKHLQKGKYRLFVYTKDTTGASIGLYNKNNPDVVNSVDVEITSNGSTVEVSDLITLDNNN